MKTLLRSVAATGLALALLAGIAPAALAATTPPSVDVNVSRSKFYPTVRDGYRDSVRIDVDAFAGSWSDEVIETIDVRIEDVNRGGIVFERTFSATPARSTRRSSGTAPEPASASTRSSRSDVELLPDGVLHRARRCREGDADAHALDRAKRRRNVAPLRSRRLDAALGRRPPLDRRLPRDGDRDVLAHGSARLRRRERWYRLAARNLGSRNVRVSKDVDGRRGRVSISHSIGARIDVSQIEIGGAWIKATKIVRI